MGFRLFSLLCFVGLCVFFFFFFGFIFLFSLSA